MKFISLLFVLSVMAVMGVLLGAMSANASAQSAQSAQSAPVTPAALSAHPLSVGVAGMAAMPSSRGALVSINPVNFETSAASSNPSSATRADSPRKTVKKRSRAKCARITGTCWGGA